MSSRLYVEKNLTFRGRILKVSKVCFTGRISQPDMSSMSQDIRSASIITYRHLDYIHRTALQQRQRVSFGSAATKVGTQAGERQLKPRRRAVMITNIAVELPDARAHSDNALQCTMNTSVHLLWRFYI